ncbi:GGDEF domain-containing protein [Nitrincola sp. MINF-07-Sa-05]|uniref:GGDEF domain-containing protein n=1 Tax=Nitrincola salilacus TaxID=3400273 RepID=UPI003918137F
MNKTDDPHSKPADFSLFFNEERVIDEAAAILEKLDDVAHGVRSLAEAYSQAYREQRRMVRLSDRMQLQLQSANHALADQAKELSQLNEALQREVEEREKLTQELKTLASVDELTGTSNRRHFYELANYQIKRHQRYQLPMALLMLDLDHFKFINDAHGHQMGDKVLKRFADTLLSLLRNVDIVGRIGGEEFGVLLPECEEGDALNKAEQICARFDAMSMEIEGQRLGLTISIGISVLSDDETIDQVLDRSDQALYAAKRAGRNRVCVWSPALKDCK